MIFCERMFTVMHIAITHSFINQDTVEWMWEGGRGGTQNNSGISIFELNSRTKYFVSETQ